MLCTSPFCSMRSSALVHCQPHGGLHGECSRALQSYLSVLWVRSCSLMCCLLLRLRLRQVGRQPNSPNTQNCRE